MARIREKTLKFPGLDNTYTFADEAPVYSASSTYKAGQFVIYAGDLYKCKADIDTAEAWTAAHWEATKIGEEVCALQNAVNGLIETPVLPSWFPAIPYQVKKLNGKWTFDDIDITNFTTQYEWKTYYVNPTTGDDTNNGTSPETAYKTLKQAITKYTSSGYPCRIILADQSVYYYEDTLGSDFVMRKSLLIEAETEATIIGGYPASTFSFEQTTDDIYASTASLSGKNIVGAVDIGEDTVDDYGLHKAMAMVSSVSDVISTQGSFCIDDSTLYVNPYTEIDNIVGLTSNSVFTPTSSNPFDEISGVSLKNIRFIGNSTITRAAHNYTAILIVDNCVFENNPLSNNFSVYGYDIIYVKNTVVGYAKNDGFNLAKGNMTTEQASASVCVFANCKAKEAGFYQTTNAHNSNLNTAHDGLNILRCGFVGYNADGPMIADVNACYSINYDVEVANNKYDYVTTANKGAFEFNSVDSARTTKQKCVDCYAYDNRAAYHNLVTDGEIWLSDGNLWMDVDGTPTIYPVEG